MNDYRITEVYNIDGKLVVADNIGEAIDLYNKYIGEVRQIKNVTLVCGDLIRGRGAIISTKVNDEIPQS